LLQRQMVVKAGSIGRSSEGSWGRVGRRVDRSTTEN